MTREQLLNDFAIRSFRDTGDQDYIAARMSCRAELSYPAYWQMQQTIEKYLKCILLLNRVHATRVGHSLSKGLELIKSSGRIKLDLQEISVRFLKHIDETGQYRYLDVSTVSEGRELLRLDCITWELRRFCTLDPKPQQLCLLQNEKVPKYELTGGVLEEIASDIKNPARAPLLWNNGFFGKRLKRTVKVNTSLSFCNAPLWMHPEILEDLCTYVKIPDYLKKEWQKHKAPFYEVPPDTESLL